MKKNRDFENMAMVVVVATVRLSCDGG